MARKTAQPAQITVITGGDGEPPMPDWRLTYGKKKQIELATAEWREIISALREANTLGVANGHAIRRLVDFRLQYVIAAAQVIDQGPVFAAKTEEANQGQWNPQWGVMRHCAKEMLALEKELGISPLSRARAGKVEKRARQPRPSDAYLKRG